MAYHVHVCILHREFTLLGNRSMSPDDILMPRTTCPGSQLAWRVCLGESVELFLRDELLRESDGWEAAVLDLRLGEAISDGNSLENGHGWQHDQNVRLSASVTAFMVVILHRKSILIRCYRGEKSPASDERLLTFQLCGHA